MKRYRILLPLLMLVLAAVACNLPNGSAPGNEATQVWGTLQAGASQTLGAPAASPTPLVWGTPTPTTSTFGTATTDPAGASIATAAAQATYNTQSMQATLEANAAWATSIVQGQAATAQAWSWSATATAAAWRPPTQQIPPPPSPPTQPSASRIRFNKGATSASVDGVLKKGWAEDYVIAAGANQWMLLSAYSPNNDVYLGVTQGWGAPMLNPNSQRSDFRALLPSTQDYILSVVSPVEKSNYTLQVILPARIQFKPGAFSATIPGYLPGGQVNYYTAKARAGQTMTVNVYSPNNDVFLTIYGLDDGSPLVRSQMGQTSWSGVLNLNQDYMIETVSTGGNVNYTLEVIIQ